jgi:soluble lytic murein transglycosylase-like protein
VPVPAPRRTTRVNPADRKHYTPLVSAVARELELDPALLHAVITVESGYNPRARSPKGAIGLMQLMPDTARRYDVADIWDPRDNLRGGARYLRDLLALFNNNLSLALAAYNAGEGAVAQHGNKIPPFAETLSYVPRVLQQYHLLNGTAVEAVTRAR